ncbi:alpha/beta fold hydrolase [Agrobacterium tumefaciens]|uniref:Alpha/beta hydrolase n=1 Tax=Agrobacterium tumefaciens TaxID=358 RepID=A0AA44F4R9_AGRTU|nr:alpha/beta hydrolase [Agrobacterium tumefaciens]NSL21316.1 alpha/beta hydrolase [Agrobacterium tumefaciens]NTB83888.1 alpha/beta hydrolase [Agrobacterium tumefaciens]NTC20643.1 alpha/beta hydrolase [Agrobacterium tumefaciens]NTC29359.1 alpha/beta hydrolase [Agrobacterium tumefaciens]NTC57855.1 alpha/beta hydrolase [Agrobacterium tumefaciens]
MASRTSGNSLDTSEKIRGNGSNYVVFIHGFLDSGEVWAKVVDSLNKADYTSVTMDLPGMGTHYLDDSDLTIAIYARRIAELIERLGKSVVLVGQSMGAQIAEYVATKLTDQVRGLVLLTPVPFGGLHAPEEALAPYKALGGNPTLQRQARHALSPNMSSENLDFLTQVGAVVAPRIVSRLVDIWNNGVEDASEKSEFHGPVLIMAGAADPFVDEEMATGTSKRFANSRLESVPGGGHWAHVESPKVVASMIDSFVKSLSSSDGAGDWKQAFSRKSANAFAEAFAEDVLLEASTLNSPIRGRENVKQVMEAASRIYEHLEFTNSAAKEPRQYEEWKAKAFGGVEISGLTVITRNEQGQIEHVAIHHRPLGAALLFSVRLGSELKGKVNAKHFASTAALPPELQRS